ERERWDAAAAAGGFSGDYNDLVNKPRLGDLQQDENYYTTVSKAERDAWNAKSTFSGSYGDLQDKPTIPAHLRDLTTDEYYMTVSTAEKETWNTKVSQADLNEFVTPTERANWNNAAANSTVAVSKTKLSDFDSNDDSKHYTVEEKTKLAGIAVNAEVNVNADWSATSGDAQIQNKPTLGTLAAKNSIGNADVASDAAIALSKINIPDNGILASKISGLADVATSGSYNDLENKPTIPANIVTYTQDVNGTITLNKSPSLSTGNNVANANEPFGDLVEAFVANNATIRAAIMEAVVEAVETTNSDLYKAIRRAAVPVGTIVMWNGELSTIPCGWDEVKNMRSRFPVGAGDGDGEGAALSGYGVKGKGGEEKHQLSISEMPSHSHEINQYAAHVPGGEKWLIDIVYKEGVYGTGSVASTGGNQAHENRPPYYAIYFIKKTSDNCPENHTEITD
ncbi:MAG: hypothetical protein LBO71_06985, partial [Prevotellaceae bacterium]|nr:hypothetical protein [Prevotellaceae bacterium]